MLNASCLCPGQIEDIYARVRAAFPKAKVAAAGLDDFVSELAAAAPDLDLPVLTQEIGEPGLLGQCRLLTGFCTALREGGLLHLRVASLASRAASQLGYWLRKPPWHCCMTARHLPSFP